MIALTVNGEAMEAAPEGRTSLADMLRDELFLTGTHLGCEHGVCGACTLMLDGAPVRSCLTLAASCAGAEVRTIEGFGEEPLMAALRAAFSRRHALQCGYCTPGMLITAFDIVRRLPEADEARIRHELAGNLCRCTGYAGIVEAIADVLRDPPPASIQPTESLSSPVQRESWREAPEGAPAAPRAAAPTGPTLSRTIDLPVPPDRVWAILRDVERVAALLPGAEVTAVEGQHVRGRFTAALGPIRARFAGEAAIRYDETGRSGEVRGGGGDRLTRSKAEGQLGFRVGGDGARSQVHLTMAYRLTGPLAQFGRPSIVEGLVDGLLERFAANLRQAVGGERVDSRPAGVLPLLRAMLRRLWRRR